MSPIISFWIAIISFLIAVISFAWGIYVYFRHENKLKKQERIINDFTIKKNREEEENKKKATLGLKGIKRKIIKDLLEFIITDWQKEGT